MNKFLLLLGLLFAQVAHMCAAKAAPLRQPVDKWMVDYGDTKCTAARAYGTKKSPLTFALQPSVNGTVVRLLLARPGYVPAPHHLPVTSSITSPTTKLTGLRFASSDKKSDILWINFDSVAVEGLGTAGEIAIRGRGAVNERFALPGIVGVLKALDKCNADLRRHWNVGDAAAGKIMKPATPLKPLPAYFSDDDYPTQALNEEASGATRIVMMIDEAGKVKDCMVEQASGIASLDAMTCYVLVQRAKFNPALDAAGKPVRSVSTTTVRWVSTMQ